MAEETVSTSATVETTTPKKLPKKAAAKTKTDQPKVSHPTTAIMVNTAIQELKEKGGSSLQAIKKYMSSTYKVDAEKLAPFIKKYIKASVVIGTLVQTKGKGASGSFKLAATGTKAKAVKSPSSPKVKQAVAKKAAAKKPKAAKSLEKEAVAAPVSPKKPSPAKKVAKPKSPAKKPAAAKPKSPAKVKKPSKSPVKKTKITKPKAAAKAKKASPKKK